MSKTISTVKKVGLGFASLTLILVAAVGLTIWQVGRTQVVTQQLVNQSVPMSDAGLRVCNGLNYALSQVRGWILIEDDRFKIGNETAWANWIDPSMVELKRLIEQFGSPTQNQQFKLLEDNLKEIKEYHRQIMALVRSDKRFPAMDLMRGQATPIAQDVLIVVDVLQEEVESDDPLHQAALDQVPLGG